MDSIANLKRFLEMSCLPAKVYFGLVVLNVFTIIIAYRNFPIEYIVRVISILLIFGLAITWVTNYMCAQGLEIVAWLILVVPITGMISLARQRKRIQ